jgi:hypothetical protein
MINWLKGISHPEAYHGSDIDGPFFEGWYHKLVNKSGHSFAIIPGIYRSEKSKNEFAFIMVLDGDTGEVNFERYNISSFTARVDKYDVSIGKNRFYNDGIDIDIKSKFFSVNGSLQFSSQYPWPVKISEPGCMGWYGYLPFMECYHGILSMDHSISGDLNYNKNIINFDQGRGYTEKDWGKNFPTTWIWVQANHFNNNRLSISASIARIPFVGTEFAGFIIGLLYEDRFYRFTTYRSAKIVSLDYDGSKIKWIVKQKDLLLNIIIEIGNRAGMLYAPDENDMVKKVPEYLDSKVSINLTQNNRIIIEDQSNLAANEIIGDLDILLDLANS